MKLKLLTAIFFLLLACDSSQVKDLVEVIDGVDRKPIDVSKMGINAFGNKLEFGTACQQYAEINNVLSLKYYRILINWNDGIQSSRADTPDFSFYDQLINCLPVGTEALLVINGLPSWMNSSANWTSEGNVRSTFIDLWFKKVVNRYKGNPRVTAFQVWNEPNMLANSENTVLEIATIPENYLEMLARAYSIVDDLAPSKLVVNAATTAINQDYRATLNYNKRLIELGAEDFLDVFAIHYYGTQYERVIDNNGIADFLNSLTKRIWVTESGEQGFDRQLAYVERTWPFLQDKIARIDRFYYYQFATNASAESAYGLKNFSQNNPVSDLYVYLRDRAR